MENNFMQIIKTRRSCRHYRDEQVDDQLLHTVMEAGTYAPTGHGTQDPQIVAVQNPALKQRLAALNAQIMGVDSIPTTTPLPICSCLHPKTIPTPFKTDRACLRI